MPIAAQRVRADDCHMTNTQERLAATHAALNAICIDLDQVERELNSLPIDSHLDEIAAAWDRFNDMRGHFDQIVADLPKLEAEIDQLAS